VLWEYHFLTEFKFKFYRIWVGHVWKAHSIKYGALFFNDVDIPTVFAVSF